MSTGASADSRSGRKPAAPKRTRPLSEDELAAADFWADWTFRRFFGRIPRDTDRELVFVMARVRAWQGIQEFDPGRGIPLKSYLVRVVQQEMMEECRRQSSHSRRTMLMIQEYRKVGRELEQWMMDPTSLSVPPPHFSRDEDEDTWEDVLVDPGEEVASAATARVDRERLQEQVDLAVQELPGRQREIVCRHDLGEETLKSLAPALGLSESGIHYHHKVAFQQLREAFTAAGIQP